MMATGWWWPSSSLPAWLGSEAVWFVALNAAVAAVAILSARARPSWSSSSSPRHGGAGVTRRASSAVLQSLRSFSIFSFPSACLSFLQPDAAAFAYQETEKLVGSPTTKPSPRALTPTPPPPAPAADEDGGDDEEDPNAMSMDAGPGVTAAAAGAGAGGGGEAVGGGCQGGGVHPRVQGGPAAAADQLHLQLHPDAQATRARRRPPPAGSALSSHLI